MRQKGWLIYHVPDVSLVHLMHQSKEQVYVPSYVAHYRSVIYLFRKHHGGGHSALVRAILFVAFSARLCAARVSALVGGRARERDVEAFRAVIRTALTYDAGDASRGIARARG